MYVPFAPESAKGTGYAPLNDVERIPSKKSSSSKYRTAYVVYMICLFNVQCTQTSKEEVPENVLGFIPANSTTFVDQFPPQFS